MNDNFNIEIVLVAPLDWGLGHATRCIPIIRALLPNYKVLVACNEKQKALLTKELLPVQFLDLEGYNIDYAKQKWWMPFKILFQVPKILKAIRRENKWLQQAIDEYKIDVVISDNRYGLHTTKKPCVFVTHQLTIQTPFAWLTSFLQKWNYKLINQFNACWVPDVHDEKNVAGVLSQPTQLPTLPVNYLGILSRFNKDEATPFKYEYCFLLSGPEPQRTILENKILKDIGKVNGKIILLRGLPTANNTLNNLPNVTIYNHLEGENLEQVLQQSEYIIARSGYTSVMELLSLQKKMILIATPGQTEQEYLSKHLMNLGWCFSVEQSAFNLEKTLKAAEQFNFQLPHFKPQNLDVLIPQLINSIKK